MFSNQNNSSNKLSLLNLFLSIVILILLAGNVFWGLEYLNVQKQLHQAQITLKTKQINERTLDFTKLFIEKVLKAKGEVNFEDRLKLENTVRNLNDKEILNQWNKFVDSKTENEAQDQVKNLLELLVDKIKIK